MWQKRLLLAGLGFLLVAAFLRLFATPSVVHRRDARVSEEVLRRAQDALARWQASCAGRSQGPCVQLDVALRPHRCTPVLAEPRILREPDEARSAMKAIRASRAELEAIDVRPLGGSDRLRIIDALARLRLAQGDQAYEQLVTLPFPEDLDFAPENAPRAKRSMRAFRAWLDDMEQAAQDASDAYARVVALEPGAKDLRRLACEGEKAPYVWFADQLESAAIPVDVRSGPYAADSADAYCVELSSQADTQRERAGPDTAFCGER